MAFRLNNTELTPRRWKQWHGLEHHSSCDRNSRDLRENSHTKHRSSACNSRLPAPDFKESVIPNIERHVGQQFKHRIRVGEILERPAIGIPSLVILRHLADCDDNPVVKVGGIHLGLCYQALQFVGRGGSICICHSIGHCCIVLLDSPASRLINTWLVYLRHLVPRQPVLPFPVDRIVVIEWEIVDDGMHEKLDQFRDGAIQLVSANLVDASILALCIQGPNMEYVVA